MFITFVEDTPASKKIPWVNTAMILLNAFVAFKTLGRPDFPIILDRYGFIPARHLGLSVMTSIFLHSSWTQLVANMSFLFMFGKGVEQTFGKSKYFLAYFLCAGVSEAVHCHMHPHSTLALIGASRVVTGMGMIYLLLYPWGRMKWIFSFFGAPLIEIPSRTLFVMGLWAAIQAAMAFLPWSKLAWLVKALSKLGGSVFTVNPTAGTAWDAHLAALIMGLVLFLVLPKKSRA